MVFKIKRRIFWIVCLYFDLFWPYFDSCAKGSVAQSRDWNTFYGNSFAMRVHTEFGTIFYRQKRPDWYFFRNLSFSATFPMNNAANQATTSTNQSTNPGVYANTLHTKPYVSYWQHRIIILKKREIHHQKEIRELQHIETCMKGHFILFILVAQLSYFILFIIITNGVTIRWTMPPYIHTFKVFTNKLFTHQKHTKLIIYTD